jgi:hypothetical protein
VTSNQTARNNPLTEVVQEYKLYKYLTETFINTVFQNSLRNNQRQMSKKPSKNDADLITKK